MDLKLAGKRALVTGSSSGIGEAIAKLLAAEGVAVVVHGRDESRANVVAQAIRAGGGSAEVALGDLTTDTGADAVAVAVLDGGPLDILVNNAGVLVDKGATSFLSWAEATPEIWAQAYNSNVISGVRMIQRLVPQMRERHWGRVIQIGGGLSQQPQSGGPYYNATLAARHNLAVSLARELKGTGVTSNVVAPGAVLVETARTALTRMAPTYGWGETWEEIERTAIQHMAPNDVGRFARPEEIAAAVAYLASPVADYVSGATLRVDGGTIRSVIYPRGKPCQCRAYRLFYDKEKVFMPIIEQWAGHFQAGDSDKVWAAAYTNDGQFLSVWGRRGSALQRGAKTLVNQEIAEVNPFHRCTSLGHLTSVPFLRTSSPIGRIKL